MNALSSPDSLKCRKANAADMDWAYQVFKAGLKHYIAQTWGWNELFQRHSFLENFPATSFTIVSETAHQNPVDIGGYCLRDQASHLYLDMLLIDVAWQRQGYGRCIVHGLQQQAAEQQLPIRLSVLKINPAFHFYSKLGFKVESEDEFRYRMRY